jgi:hypothetical protein
MTSEHEDDDDFDIEFEAQQMRAVNFREPFRGTIRNLDKHWFEFGERVRIWFDENNDYYLPYDSDLSAIAQGIGSRKKSAWIGAELELVPTSYTNRKGEVKFVFAPRVVKARIPSSEDLMPSSSPNEPKSDNSRAVVEFDDAIPFE